MITIKMRCLRRKGTEAADDGPRVSAWPARRGTRASAGEAPAQDTKVTASMSRSPKLRVERNSNQRGVWGGDGDSGMPDPKALTCPIHDARRFLLKH